MCPSLTGETINYALLLLVIDYHLEGMLFSQAFTTNAKQSGKKRIT